MSKTSIHIKPVVAGSEKHNKRLKELSYVRKELTCLNEYWESGSQADRRAAIKEKYFKTVGQKLQSKATPIREGVVVIKSDTSMDDLRKLADAIKAKFGIETFQIAIHKDEGHPRSKMWISNLHAHLVFDWTDQDTGKSIKMNRDQMTELQTLCAEVLGMERGQSSDRKHLSALQFKVAKEEERVEELTEEVDAKVREKEELDKQTGIVAKVAAAFNVGPMAAIRKENEQLKAEKEAAEAARKDVIVKARDIIAQEREKATAAENQAKNDLSKANNLNTKLKAELMELQNKLKPNSPMRDILVGDPITFSEHEEYKDEWVAKWRDLIVATARIKKDGSVDITEWHPDQESHSYDHASNLNEAWRRIYNYAWGDFEPEWRELYGQGRGRGM